MNEEQRKVAPEIYSILKYSVDYSLEHSVKATHDTVVEHLDAMVTADEPKRAALLEEYRAVSATIGKTVLLSSPEGEWRDRAVDVDENGRLLLESGKVILSGDVSVRGLYEYSE